MRRLATCTGAVALGFLVAAPISNSRQLSAGHYALQLEGVSAGFLKSIDGGATFAEVIEEGGIGGFTRKVPGRPKYENLELEAGLSLSPAFYELVSEFVKGGTGRHDGSVVAIGVDLKPQSELAYHDAFVTKVRFPWLDASSKEEASLGVTLAPEQLQWAPTQASKLPSFGIHEKWLRSNFRLELGSLPCNRVKKIEAFTVKTQVQEADDGSQGGFSREPGAFEVSNLKVTISKADLAPWADWFESFVIGGENGQDDELEGKITYLSPTLEPLGHVVLKQVGIFLLDHFAPSADDAIGTFVVELYVEGVEFHHGAETRGS